MKKQKVSGKPTEVHTKSMVHYPLPQSARMDTGCTVPWDEIRWSTRATDGEGKAIFKYVQFETRCQASGKEPGRAFCVVSLNNVLGGMRGVVLQNAPSLYYLLQQAGRCRVSGSSVCIAITYTFEGHCDQRAHLIPGDIEWALHPSEADLIARTLMPTKGNVIVSHTICGATELCYFNKSGIKRAEVSLPPSHMRRRPVDPLRPTLDE